MGRRQMGFRVEKFIICLDIWLYFFFCYAAYLNLKQGNLSCREKYFKK